MTVQYLYRFHLCNYSYYSYRDAVILLKAHSKLSNSARCSHGTPLIPRLPTSSSRSTLCIIPHGDLRLLRLFWHCFVIVTPDDKCRKRRERSSLDVVYSTRPVRTLQNAQNQSHFGSYCTCRKCTYTNVT
jgi:hypothetical protein